MVGVRFSLNDIFFVCRINVSLNCSRQKTSALPVVLKL